MLTSASADQPVRLSRGLGSGRHACPPDREQTGVGVDQALLAYAGRLERLAHHQARAILVSDHPLLHRKRLLSEAPDADSVRPYRRQTPGRVARYAGSFWTTRSPAWQDCTGGHNPPLRQQDEALGACNTADDNQRQAEQKAGEQDGEAVVDAVGEHGPEPVVEGLDTPKQVARAV